jgi:hypothetical protein
MRPESDSQLQVPFGYCWSPAVLPKPPDWGPHIDVCGYFVLREGSLTHYSPPEALQRFLATGTASIQGFVTVFRGSSKSAHWQHWAHSRK